MPEIKKVDSSLYKVLTTGSIMKLANRLLTIMNKNITDHNLRTAYIALKIAQHHPMKEPCTLQNLIFLCMFHTIGFYRDDIFYDENDDPNHPDYFSETRAVMSKYIFGCYYLEYMTPLNQDARALETFNQPFNKDLKTYIYQEEYKSILYISARISDYLITHENEDLPDNLYDLAPGYFDPEYVEVFKEINKNNEIVNNIRNHNFKPELFTYIHKIDYPIEAHVKMVKLLIYLLDFKSTFTMKHSINTACYSVCLGIRLGLEGKELVDLFISAFLHDVGKIAIPPRILESPNKLSEKDMAIMKSHVEFSRKILNGILSDKIVENVYRHHEKLNGKGYPLHISGDQLTLAQRILTVSDITSALNDSRSYKCEFSKEKVVMIIRNMTEKGELDPEVTKYILNDF